MDYLIAPTLFQNKICRLPGIGTLEVITNAAETDFVNSKIKAPLPSIIFSASQDDANIFNEFTALSELIQKDLNDKGIVPLKGVGQFIKNEEGIISFVSLQLNERFTPTVTAENIMRQHAEHTILVGDKKTTNTVMTEYFVEEENENEQEEQPKKDRWWISAIVLGVVGLAIIVFYILQNGFNLLGNSISF